MITHELRGWSVNEQRLALASSTHTAPVLVVPAGSRRTVEIVWAQTRAMGLVNDLHAKRVGAEHIKRWWRAWTQASVGSIHAFVPDSTRPGVLLDYVAALADWGVDVHLWCPPELPDSTHIVLEELSSSPSKVALPAPAAVETGRSGPTESLPQLAPPLMLDHLRCSGNADLAATLLEVAGSATAQLAKDASAAAFLHLLLATCRDARTATHLEVTLHGLALGAWSAGLPIGLEPRTVATLAGPALMALSPDGPGDRAGRWLDAVRGAAIVLSLTHLGPAAACTTTIEEAATLATDLHGMAAATLRAAVTARHDDEAQLGDPLLVDPTRGSPVTTATVARWLRLGQRDQGLPLLHGPTSKVLRSPEKALHQIGVSWRN